MIVINSFNSLNITLNINQQNFDCEFINQQINSSQLVLTLSTLFNCDISLNDIGIFPIYISIDQGNSYYQLPQDFTVYQYVDNSSPGTIVSQNPIIATSISNNNTIIFVSIGLGTGFVIVSLLVFLMKCTKNKKIRERLIKLDLLYITLRHKKIEEIKEHTRDAYLGLGNTYYIRSTLVGGLLTIYLIIIAIFFAIAYLNDTYQNNVEINTYLGTSNGAVITNGFINTKITFNELLYGTCDNLCSNWEISSNNLQNNVVVGCTETKITNVLSNCLVTWGCTNCNTIINTDSIISFALTGSNLAFKSFDYEIDINSYQGTNILTGSVVPKTNNLLISENMVSLVSNPTALDDGGIQTAGYSLDYLNLVIGNTINLNNLSSINSGITSNYVNNLYTVNYVNTNTIGVNIKISQNPSWLFITKSQKSSFFTIFFQLISLLVALFSIAKITLNLITKKRILRCILNIVNCGKSDKKKNVKDNSLSDVRINSFGSNVNNDIGMATLKNSPAKDTIIDEEMSVSINV